MHSGQRAHSVADDPCQNLHMAFARIERGGRKVALGWLAKATLPKTELAALRRFVDRFPSLEFYRDTPRGLEAAERGSGGPWPAWFRAVRLCLAGVTGKPYHARIRFDAFERDDSPRADGADTIWYTFGAVGYPNDEQRALLRERCTALPFAYEDRGLSILAVGIGKDNRKEVWEFCEEDLRDNEAEGVDADDSCYVAFDSYRAMLDRICAVEVAPGRVVEAHSAIAARRRVRIPSRR